MDSPLKWLSIVDEYARKSPTLMIARHITIEDVIDALAELFAERDVPQCIRSNNGPEFIGKVLRDWLQWPAVYKTEITVKKRLRGEFSIEGAG